MATTTNKLVTFAELEQMPDTDDRYELRHGELVKVPPPKFGHYEIQQRLRDLLSAAARKRGRVGTEFGFRALPEHEYRVADVAFASQERLARVRRDGYFEGAPDIVIEVLSPSNSATEMLDREQLCLANGSVEFWVVDPERRQVKVSTRDGHAATYKIGEQIPLLFGGSITVNDIFAQDYTVPGETALH